MKKAVVIAVDSSAWRWRKTSPIAECRSPSSRCSTSHAAFRCRDGLVVSEKLTQKGVQLALRRAEIHRADGFRRAGRAYAIRKNHEAGIVILAIGVRPETRLAAEAGLVRGSRGGNRVDQHMRTSDQSIWRWAMPWS